MGVDKKISDLSLRLLGYYNNVGQFLAEETEYINFTRELAKLLKKSFDAIDDVNYDNDFAKALANGVFIMRDKDSNLYAYWPKENIARVTNVTYDRENITILPLEYKYWFTPGNPIQIAKIGTINTITPQKTFYEYVGSSDYIGKHILLQADYLSGNSISGELLSVGKDFLSIKDNKSDILLVTNHLCVRINLSENRNAVANDFKEKSDTLTALGIITKFDKERGLGYIKSLTGEKLGLRAKELLEENLKVGSEVVFSVRTEEHPNGKKMSQATSVHSPNSVTACLDLARTVSKSAARDIIQQILDEYPDNQYALLEQLKLPASIGTEKDEDSIKYAKACELLFQSEDKQKAIKDLTEVLDKGKKVKDCIPKIAMGYYMQYSSEEDEEIRNIYRRNLYEFIQSYHSKLNAKSSLNIRLNYFDKLEFNEDYLQVIDSILQDPATDSWKRAKMLYFKALKYIQLGKKEQGLKFAKESLFYNPLGNKAETLFPEYNENEDSELSFSTEFGRAWSIFFNIIPSEGHYENLLTNIKTSNNNNLKAQYISARASELLENSKSTKSSLYLWREIFRVTPKFGYFVQENLAKMLSSILGGSTIKDKTIETAKEWENKKNWKEILSDAINISKEQWMEIFYACNANASILKHLEEFININSNLKNSLYVNFSQISSIYELFEQSQYLSCDKKALNLFNASIRNKKTLYDQYSGLSELNYNNPPFVELSPTNSYLLKCFKTECLPILQSFIYENNPEDKTLKSRILDDVLKKIFDLVVSTPTEFGIEGICTCIETIERSLRGVKTITRKNSQSDISIEIIEKNVYPDSEGLFHIRVRAMNAHSTINASNICFELISEDLNDYKVKTVNINKIQGGATHDFEYIVGLKQSVVEEGKWVFSIKCSYKSDDEKFSKTFPSLQVHLSPSAFVPIEKNPYTYGPALKSTDPTFVGRKKDINEIIETVLHSEREGSQLIVYGQKRCGKSSLVQAVQSKLEKDYHDSVLCVYMTLHPDNKQYSESDFYYDILSSIKTELKVSFDQENTPSIEVPARKDFKQSESPTETFCNSIRGFKQSMKNCIGWETKRLVLIIDEFTILYNRIKKGVAPEEILHHWKAIQESKDTNFATIFVGHDITPTFFAEPYASNATAIIEKRPLSYLSREEATELITKPIECNGESRFEDKAVEVICEYTACSPSYLQQFMQKMVQYINSEKIAKVSDGDVHEVAQKFIRKVYDNFSSITDFDNLINSGLEDKFSTIKDKDIENVLRAIAHWSKGIEWANLEDISKEFKKNNTGNDKAEDHLNIILSDLDSRKVIERKENNTKIKIKVGIFKEWLIRN